MPIINIYEYDDHIEIYENQEFLFSIYDKKEFDILLTSIKNLYKNNILVIDYYTFGEQKTLYKHVPWKFYFSSLILLSASAICILTIFKFLKEWL